MKSKSIKNITLIIFLIFSSFFLECYNSSDSDQNTTNNTKSNNTFLKSECIGGCGYCPESEYGGLTGPIFKDYINCEYINYNTGNDKCTEKRCTARYEVFKIYYQYACTYYCACLHYDTKYVFDHYEYKNVIAEKKCCDRRPCNSRSCLNEINPNHCGGGQCVQ